MANMGLSLCCGSIMYIVQCILNLDGFTTKNDSIYQSVLEYTTICSNEELDEISSLVLMFEKNIKDYRPEKLGIYYTNIKELAKLIGARKKLEMLIKGEIELDDSIKEISENMKEWDRILSQENEKIDKPEEKPIKRKVTKKPKQETKKPESNIINIEDIFKKNGIDPSNWFNKGE